RLKELRKMVEVWEGKGHSLERLLSNRVARIKELEELVSDRANRVRELEQELDHKSRAISRLETDVEAGGVKDLALIELETETAAMRARLRDLDALASSQSAENSSLRDQLREHAEEVIRLRESLEHRDADLEELRETVLELDGSASDKGEALEKVQRELAKLQQENNIARQQLSGETSSRRELERTLYQKEEALAEALDLANRRAEQIAGLEQHLQEALSTGTVDRGKIMELETALDDSREREQELARLRQEVQRLRLACERSTQAAEEKSREVESTRSALALLEQQIHDRDELVGDLEQLLELREEHLSSMQSSLDETSQRQKSHQAQLEELETALARERDRVRELLVFQQGDDQRVAALSHQLTVKDSRIRSLEAALAEKNSKRAQQEEDADSITGVRTRLLETCLRNEELEKNLQQLKASVEALGRQAAEQASVIGTLEQKLVSSSSERNQAWAQLDALKQQLDLTSRELERLQLEYENKSRAWERERQEREELLVRGERMEKAQGEEICRLKERLLRTMAEKSDLEGRLQAC
ncbi:MAG: hypothetical protein KC910_26460, partial [Candidatus Eremiobacteraeota bacterium]|nr:hypothetical protein [Candidatus Eremiobacteraeota bacterium]